MRAAGGPRGCKRPPFTLPLGLLDRDVLVSGAQNGPRGRGAPQADASSVLTLTQGCDGGARAHPRAQPPKHGLGSQHGRPGPVSLVN